MKIEEAVSGRFIERGSMRVRVIGNATDGSVVVEDEKGYLFRSDRTEWMIECLDDDVITMWRKDKPYATEKEKIHAIGTREVEVPL